MKSVSKLALTAILALGGVSVVATAPAMAQKKKEAAAAPEGRKFNLSKEERAAIAALQAAITANDTATAASLIPAAQAAAKGADAKYLVGSMQIRLGIATKDTRLQGQGIDAMIASGAAPAADLPMLYRNQGALAAGLGDKAKAEAAFAKLIEIAPNDPDAMIMLAETSADAKKLPQAVALIDRAIVAKKAAGATVPETWYKRGLKLSYDAKMTPQSLKFTRDLIAAYPTTTNWRDGLLIYRDLANPDRATDIDALRLMRVTKSLNGERDFFELADAANDGGLPGETKAVLDEGIAVKMVDPNKATFKELLATAGRRATEDRKTLPGLETKANAAATGSAALSTGDAFYGYGDYAKAAALYRAALKKGSVDANTANMRLGMALALSGQKAEAEAALRAVTGPRAELANYWLLWLSQRS